jgi:hypothetical protein
MSSIWSDFTNLCSSAYAIRVRPPMRRVRSRPLAIRYPMLLRLMLSMAAALAFETNRGEVWLQLQGDAGFKWLSPRLNAVALM